MLAVRHIAPEQLPELRAVLQLACGKASLLYHAESDWRSATLEGVRHTIALEFKGRAAMYEAGEFADALAQHDFVLPGKICADASVVHVHRQTRPEPCCELTIVMLVLEDHVEHCHV